MSRSSLTIAALLAGSLITSQVGAQQHSLWRFAADTDVTYFTQTPLGSVLVVAGPRLASIDPASGTVSWTIPDSSGIGFAGKWEQTIPFTPYLWVLGDDGIGIVDLQSGAWKWRDSSSTFRTSLGSLFIPAAHLLLDYVKPSGGRPLLRALEIETGRVRWQSDSLLAREPQTFDGSCCNGRKPHTIQPNLEPLLVNDSVIVFWISEDGPVAVNAKTGARLWHATALAGKRPPSQVERYAPMVAANGVVYVPYESNLIALDLATGAPVWSKPRDYHSHVVQMQLVPRGLLVRTQVGIRDGGFTRHPALELLDPKSGALLWPEAFGDLDESTPFVVRGDTAFIGTVGHSFMGGQHEQLMAVPLDSGKARQVAEYDFKDDEHPLMMDQRPAGLVLLSQQNILMVDSAGLVRYHTYFPPPKAGALKRFGLAALVLAANIAVYSAGSNIGDATRMTMIMPMVTPTIDTRYRATVEMQRYTYVVTPVPDSTGELVPGLVRVNKDTGKDEGRVALGGKVPYVIDEAEGRVYILLNPRELIAEKF